jgi:8-oxo-dGTP diphosphatase
VTPGPELCVGAIVVLDGALLLVQRAFAPGAGEWSVPGGRVERGETLVEAVVRELAEETGLEGICGELVGIVERFDDDADGSTHYVILDFRVTVIDDAEPRAGSDAVDARWVPLEDVAEMLLVDGLAEFLHEHGILRTIV